MNKFPKTNHDWVYETLDVNAIAARRERLSKYLHWVVILAMTITLGFICLLFQLHVSGNLDDFNQGWGIVVSACFALLACAFGVFLAEMESMAPINREALAQMAQDIAEYPELKKQLLQQLLFQNNVLYDAQRKAFQGAIHRAKMDKALANLTENTPEKHHE